MKPAEFSRLRQAVWRRDVDEVRRLLEGGADPNDASDVEQPGWSILNSAVEEGRPEVVELLLRYGADPNIPDARDAPLTQAVDLACTYASEGGFFEPRALRVIGLLLQFGADPTLPSLDGLTPIDAARYRRMELLEPLAVELERWAQ